MSNPLAQSENGSKPDETHQQMPDEQTLRDLTGAPSLKTPLMHKDAFSDIDVQSSRPIWKLPFPKLALIGLALVPVFGMAGYFLSGGKSTVTQTEIPEAPSSGSDESIGSISELDEEVTELEVANQEIASLRSQMALQDQAYIQSQQQSTPESIPENAAQNVELNAEASPVAATPSPPPPTSPPTVSYRPTPPSIQTRPAIIERGRSTSASAVGSTSSSTVSDPFERWQQLAQVGSYGGSTPQSSSPPGEIATDNASIRSREDLTTIPTAYYSERAPRLQNASYGSFREQLLNDESESSPQDLADSDRNEELALSASPDILVEAEDQILSNDLSSPLPSVRSLLVGGTAAGELVTPIVLDSESIGDRFIIVLSEALTDTASQVAIPSGSLLVVQVDRVATSGLVQLSATQAIWEEQGSQRELMLPAQTLLIRGDEGNPLIAQQYGDIGGEIASMDMGQFAIGALRRIGELYTRTDTQVRTGDGTTIVTESSPAPNVLAGALEGGADALLDTLTERNQQAVESMRQRERVPFLPAGLSVQVFVNQSMQMPEAF